MEMSDVGEHVYAAECIIMSRMNKARVEYLIKWKGWGHKHNTWEPEKNIIDKRLLKDFHRKQSKRNGEATARRSVMKAKKVSIEGVKRPRGRPPLPENLKRRMKEEKERLSRAAAEAAKPPVAGNTAEKPPTPRHAVNATAHSRVPETSESPPVVVKKRRKQGPRGMARLFVNQPRSKVNGSTRPSYSTAEPELSQPSTAAAESPKVPEGNLRGPEILTDADPPVVPSLSSPIWQPASKRVLDAVCVTDITACSGVTVTVRESTVVDGFFRSRPE